MKPMLTAVGLTVDYLLKPNGNVLPKVSPPANPKGPGSGTFRVFRGGGWYSGSGNLGIQYLRCSFKKDKSTKSQNQVTDIFVIEPWTQAPSIREYQC